MLTRACNFSVSRISTLLKLEFVRISLILSVLILIFFSGPLLNVSKTYYSPADMLQGTPVFAVEGERRYPHNSVLGDDIYAYLPWIEFSWRSLKQGEMPLWNPYNAGGRPLLANMQSSIFYPSQWPSFILGQRLGLLARCMLHLYLAGLFSYYFFRSLKVRMAAGLIGAISFMFAGMMVVWLYNELSATFLLFPLLLMVIERRLNRTSSNLRFVIELSLAVMLQIFGGHPETIYLSVSLATLYLIYRLATDKANWSGWTKKLQILGLYVGGGLWGILLGAIQLFPFVEYLLNSASLASRSSLKAGALLPPQYLLSFVLPDPFGNPAFGSKLDFAKPNYSEVSGSYVGPTILFMAICSLWVARRRPLVWFFWAVNVTIVQLVYQIGPLHELFIQLQPVTIFYSRLMGYAGFFLITLMVFTLDGLLSQNWLLKLKLTRPAGLVAGAGGLFLLGLILLFWWFSNAKLVPFEQIKVNNFESRDFLIITGLFIISVIGLVWLIRIPKYGLLGVLVLGFAVFGQLAFFGSNYRAAIPQNLFFPETGIVKELKQTGGRVAPAGTPGLLPAEANVWYGIEQVNGYDSLEVRWFEQLRQASVERWPEWDNFVPLNLFNIKQVIASSADQKFQANRSGCCDQLIPTFKQRGINIYRNQNYLPTYRMVYQSANEPEPQALRNLLDGQINPLEKLVFVEGEAPSAIFEGPGPYNPVAVEVLSKTSNHVNLQVHNPQPGYLYVDQTYFPGWEARINGQSARLYRANIAFTALPLDQGDFKIELNYNPLSFRLGLFLTIGGGLITFLVAFLQLIRKFQIKPSSSKGNGPAKSLPGQNPAPGKPGSTYPSGV